MVVYGVVLGALHVGLAAPERCGPASAETARAAAASGTDWLLANQRDDGSFVYLYDRDRGDLGGYSTVRHAGAMLALYQAASALDDDFYFDAGNDALVWMIGRLTQGDGWAAFREGTQAPLGAVALTVAALAERRAYTGDDGFDGFMRDLGRFLTTLQRDDGGFHVSYDLATGRPDRVSTSRYYPGEATWALARLGNIFPEEGWRRAAQRGAAFLATRRDDLEGVRFPPLNDHWAAYAFAEMADWPLGDDEIAYARALYGRFHLLIRSQAQQESGGLYALTHGPDRRGAAVGTWLEGQAALWRLAQVDDRFAAHEPRIAHSVRCAAAVLTRRQVREDEAATVEENGAWFAGGETRVDDQQHPVSGLLAAAALMEGSDSA